jgi:hypothetical protein
MMNAKVLDQIKASGLQDYFVSFIADGNAYRGTVRLGVLDKLKADDSFCCGPFYRLHLDVGDNLIEYRSHTGTFGKGSLQLVIDQTTGRYYADVDLFSPYSDLVGVVGHLVGEVVGGWFKRKKQA